MKILINNYYKNYGADIVIYELPKRDCLYLSDIERRDNKYDEEFILYFNHKTHEIIEEISEIDLMYMDECFDGFSLKDVRNDGHGEFVDKIIEKCKIALYEELGLIDKDEDDLEK